jgi:alpha-beta hydrolase superfamily lysophospholipase
VTAATETSLRTADGIELFARAWAVPEGAARRGALLLVHGLGEHSGRHDRLARELAGMGLEVRAYDLRGHGRSGGPRGGIPHAGAHGDDLALAFGELERDAREQGDEAPPLLLGHSLGGAFAARAVTSGALRPRGLILSSPALAFSVRPHQRLMAFAGRRLIPDVAVPNGLDRDGLSHDPAVRAAYEADPLVHDRISARLYDALAAAGAEARRDAGSVRVPTLLLVSGSDRLVDPAGSRELFAALPAGVGTLHVYDELFHELFNEREPDRARVLADLRAWLAPVLAGERVSG